MGKIKRALLGDREAQRAVTERGELLPCPHCGKNAEIIKNKTLIGDMHGIRCEDVDCCGFDKTAEYSDLMTAVEDWNTRPQLLTAEELQRLEENNNV